MADKMRTPIATHLVIGDSNATRFDGLIYESPAGPIVYKARWLPGLRTNALFTSGRVSEFVTRALREQRLLMKGGVEEGNVFPILQEQNSHQTVEHVVYQPRTPEDAVVLFVVAGPDAIDLTWELHPAYDLDLGDRMPFVKGAPPYVPAVGLLPLEQMTQRIEARLRPLFDAVDALRGCGFERVMVHDIQPTAWTQPAEWAHPLLRLKITVLINEFLQQQCARRGVPYIRVWDAVFEDGARAKRYDRDGEHLLPEACRTSLDQISQALSTEANV